VGATPRLVDVDPSTATITAATVEPAINCRTRCIVPVHLYGRTTDMDPILKLARDAGIPIVEDACQAHGALYRGRPAGSMGELGCFSFYPAKNLGAWGDGGAVVTSNPQLDDRIRLLRSHGERPRYHHQLVGTTARLDAIQAAVLRTKLPRLAAWNDQRRDNGARLTELLEGGPVAAPAPASEGCDHVFHQYVVTTNDRDGLRRHLDEQGVASGVHYPVPIHLTGAYADLCRARGALPVAEELADRICTLPVFPGLTAAELEQVADAVRSWQPEARPSSGD
jgi:dTDP-4-amino-4,6-dideoxygalactose transaminase